MTEADQAGADAGRRPVAEDELVVARLGKAHGLRGELTVQVRTDAPDLRLAPGARLRTDRADGTHVVVAGARWHGSRLVLAVEGVGSREAAERLRDVLLLVPREDSPPSEDPEEFWDHQLIGLAARLEDGTPLGTVAEVVHLPGQSLLALRDPARRGGAEVLVPFVAAVVPVVDLTAGEVVVDPPPGLLDPDPDADPGAGG